MYRLFVTKIYILYTQCNNNNLHTINTVKAYVQHMDIIHLYVIYVVVDDDNNNTNWYLARSELLLCTKSQHKYTQHYPPFPKGVDISFDLGVLVVSIPNYYFNWLSSSLTAAYRFFPLLSCLRACSTYLFSWSRSFLTSSNSPRASAAAWRQRLFKVYKCTEGKRDGERSIL